MKTTMESIDVQTINFIPDVKAPLETFYPRSGGIHHHSGVKRAKRLISMGFQFTPTRGWLHPHSGVKATH